MTEAQKAAAKLDEAIAELSALSVPTEQGGGARDWPLELIGILVNTLRDIRAYVMSGEVGHGG